MNPGALRQRRLKEQMELLAIERDRHWQNYCKTVTEIMRLAVELEVEAK